LAWQHFHCLEKLCSSKLKLIAFKPKPFAGRVYLYVFQPKEIGLARNEVGNKVKQVWEIGFVLSLVDVKHSDKGEVIVVKEP